MKIAVIAANGRSGQAFVAAALAAGHQIRAGVLGNGTLPPHPQLEIIACDATIEADVRQLTHGQDAVASFIGHVKGSPPTVQTDAIKQLVQIMQTAGPKRIVSLTGTGVRFAGDRITWLDRFLNAGISIIDPQRIADGRRHVDVLKQSNLEWTVIRVLKLQTVEATPFTLCAHGPTKPYVGREEVAQAVLQVLEQHSFIQQAPIISANA